MKVQKFTEAEIKAKEILEEDIAQEYRECYSCGYMVSVDDQSENICDQCNE